MSVPWPDGFAADFTCGCPVCSTRVSDSDTRTEHIERSLSPSPSVRRTNARPSAHLVTYKQGLESTPPALRGASSGAGLLGRSVYTSSLLMPNSFPSPSSAVNINSALWENRRGRTETCRLRSKSGLHNFLRRQVRFGTVIGEVRARQGCRGDLAPSVLQVLWRNSPNTVLPGVVSAEMETATLRQKDSRTAAHS